MEDLLRPLHELQRESALSIALNVADVLVVGYFIYRILALLRGSKAMRISIGILVLYLVLLIASSSFHLETLHWLLDKAAILAPVALVILFFPELRQGLEIIPKLGLWAEKIVGNNKPMIETQAVEEIVAAAAEMSVNKIGALIVIEQTAPLSEVIATGVRLDARLSSSMLLAIFQPGNPLHDGATVIHGSTIVSAACRLPLSESPRLESSFHMRHRAALGLTEQQDAVVIVVSEERGSISIVADGKLRRLSGPSELRDVLRQNSVSSAKSEPTPEKRRIFARAKQAR